MTPRLRLLFTCAFALALGACSGGGSGTNNAVAGAKPCPIIEHLDQTAASVAALDVSDPTTSKKAMDAAVKQYADSVVDLKGAVPSELHGDLDRLESAVRQYRFADAAEARSSLDAYATAECGRSRPGVSTSVPTTAAR